MSKSERRKYTMDDEINLLRDVIAYDFCEDDEKWQTVQRNLYRLSNKAFTLRGIRDHVDYLLKLYVAGDYEKLKRSGRGKGQYEKDFLLEILKKLCKKVNNLRKSANESTQMEAELQNSAVGPMSINDIVHDPPAVHSEVEIVSEELVELTEDTGLPPEENLVSNIEPAPVENSSTGSERLRILRNKLQNSRPFGDNWVRQLNKTKLELQKIRREFAERNRKLQEHRRQMDRIEEEQKLNYDTLKFEWKVEMELWELENNLDFSKFPQLFSNQIN